MLGPPVTSASKVAVIMETSTSSTLTMLWLLGPIFHEIMIEDIQS